MEPDLAGVVLDVIGDQLEPAGAVLDIVADHLGLLYDVLVARALQRFQGGWGGFCWERDILPRMEKSGPEEERDSV